MPDRRGGQHEPNSTPLPRRARVAGMLLAAAVAAGAVVATTSTAALLEARREHADALRATARAERDGAATAADLTAQQAFLAEAAVDLEAARHALAAADEALDAVADERAEVAAELEAARAELALLQEALTGAASQAFANAGTVNALAVCLDGVSELVNQLSVGDQAGAVRTADAIEPACALVGAAIG